MYINEYAIPFKCTYSIKNQVIIMIALKWFVLFLLNFIQIRELQY